MQHNKFHQWDMLGWEVVPIFYTYTVVGRPHSI